MSGYFEGANVTSKSFWIWVATSLTFFQFYNPDFLRGYGVGAINGSLWTIAVELQFYALVPIIFITFNKYKNTGLAAFLVLVLINVANTFFNTRESIIEKLIDVSFAPWVYMFIFGAYVSTNKLLQKRILSINLIFLLSAYIFTYYLSRRYDLGAGNGINIVCFVILGCLILKLANTRPALSRKILRNNDISYGVYIYHMPIVNFFVFNGYIGATANFVMVMALAYALSFSSWKLVERPALGLKRIALRRFT